MNRSENQSWQRILSALARRAKAARLIAIVGLLMLGGVAIARVHAFQTRQRPLADFINAQGTTTCFTPPAPAQLGATSDPDKGPVRFALFDYTGKVAALLQNMYGISLGTTVTGTVTERPLADGRVEVTVNLHTRDALAWAINLDLSIPQASQFNNNPLLFGARAQDLIANPSTTPALGDIHLRIVFKNTAPGAALPDLVCINSGPDCPTVAPCPAGFEIDFFMVEANATGPLHAASGFPEGSTGRLDVVQTGLIKPAISNGFKGALSDAFPAERVDLRQIGH
jgi:hypothetical protein